MNAQSGQEYVKHFAGRQRGLRGNGDAAAHLGVHDKRVARDDGHVLNQVRQLDIAEIDAVALLICWRIHLRRSLWQCQKKGSRGNGSQQKMRYTVS